MAFAPVSEEQLKQIGAEVEFRLDCVDAKMGLQPSNGAIIIDYLKTRDLPITADNVLKSLGACVTQIIWIRKPRNHPDELHKKNLAGIRVEPKHVDIDASVPEDTMSPSELAEKEIVDKKVAELEQELTDVIGGYGVYRGGRFIASATQERRAALRKIRVTGKGSKVADLQATQQAVREAIQKYPD